MKFPDIFRPILTLLLLSATCTTGYALDFSELYERYFDNPPERQLQAECREVANPNSACNQGDEPFLTFLKKFEKSPEFRRERTLHMDYNGIYLDIADESGDSFEFSVYTRNDKCENQYATWFNVSRDRVCYWSYTTITCYNDEDEDGDGSCAGAVFIRIDGKWYLEGMLVIG